MKQNLRFLFLDYVFYTMIEFKIKKLYLLKYF